MCAHSLSVSRRREKKKKAQILPLYGVLGSERYGEEPLKTTVISSTEVSCDCGRQAKCLHAQPNWSFYKGACLFIAFPKT